MLITKEEIKQMGASSPDLYEYIAYLDDLQSLLNSRLADRFFGHGKTGHFSPRGVELEKDIELTIYPKVWRITGTNQSLLFISSVKNEDPDILEKELVDFWKTLRECFDEQREQAMRNRRKAEVTLSFVKASFQKIRKNGTDYPVTINMNYQSDSFAFGLKSPAFHLPLYIGFNYGEPVQTVIKILKANIIKHLERGNLP